jgi:DNA-binding HxlR family transcriptional regulator
MNPKKDRPGPRDCKTELIAIKDTMELLSGKWKIQIVGALMLTGRIRFMDLLRETPGIAAKMLSKELQELEQNGLVARSVMHTKPITVEYELTEHGQTLKRLIEEIRNWGMEHRKFIKASIINDFS